MERILPNLFCLLVLFVVLVSFYFQYQKNDKTSKKFTILLYSVMFYMLLNTLAELCEGNPKFNILATITNLFIFLSVDVIVIAFTVYLQSLLKSLNCNKNALINTLVLICLIRVLIIFVLFLANKLFYIDENGNYQEYSLTIIPYVIIGIILIVHTVNIITCRKFFIKKYFVVILLYLMLPVPAMIAELYTNIYSLSSYSITLSSLLIYVLIQVEITQKIKHSESIFEELSTKDFLTKLYNRLSYDKKINEVKNESEVGIVYCDINNLKTTNDNLGHTAGDQLIVKFSNILLQSFQFDSIFRISGDEFVVILPKISFVLFSDKMELFKGRILENDNIASIGSAYGKGINIEDLVIEAENNMYLNKKELGIKR